MDADPSRVSRLLRRLAAWLPNGEVVRLRNLCLVARDLHHDYVAQAIERERVRMVEDRILVTMTDREIAAGHGVARIRGAAAAATAAAAAHDGLHLKADG